MVGAIGVQFGLGECNGVEEAEEMGENSGLFGGAGPEVDGREGAKFAIVVAGVISRCERIFPRAEGWSLGARIVLFSDDIVKSNLIFFRKMLLY